jgi:uncharacterized protein YtpQ (UPF0354 family)
MEEHTSDSGVCKRAIAYLKGGLGSGDAGKPIPVATNDPNSPMLRHFVDDLHVAYVVDDGNALRYVQKRDLDAEGIDADRLHEIGLGNLKSLSLSRLQVRTTGEGAFAALLDGNFEASRILLDGLWDIGLAHVVPHDLVVCIPARDILAFCAKDSREGMANLRRIAARVSKSGDHLLTSSLYHRTHGNWRQLA